MSTSEEASRFMDEVIERGQRVYDERLKSRLEPEHTGRFVAIEPESARYFLGDTGTGALVAAHEAMPESRFYLRRVGYDFTHQLGGHGVRHG